MADKDAYYFSHDSNARHDPKIVKMLCKYKYGYQWYFMIIEILRDQADYKYKMDEYYCNAIARDLHEDSTVIADFVNDCIKEFDLFMSDGEKFWSKSLLTRMKIKEQKSKKYRENAKKRWENNASNGNATAMQLQSIKGKEKKVKKSKVFIPPTLQDVKDFFALKGYTVQSATTAFNHYDLANWHDTEGKPVKSWKQKMNTVWFKPENKIPPAEDKNWK